MNEENLYISISFLLVLIIAYKPVKAKIDNSINAYISDIKDTISEAKKIYEASLIHLKDLKDQMDKREAINKNKLLQNQHILDSIKIQNEHYIEDEIRKQLEMAEVQRNKDEEIIKKEIIREFIHECSCHIMKEMQGEKGKRDREKYFKVILNKLSKTRFFQ